MSDCPELAPQETVGPLRTDTLADSVLILLTLTVLQRLVGFCRAVLFCRWLEPEELGQWDLAFSFLLLAGPLSVLALSSSLNRYLEYYRQRSQMRTLLRRTAGACLALGLAAVAVIWLARGWFSQLIFGTPQRTDLVVLLTAGLLAVIGFNYFIDLFSALRNVRLLAGLQLLHSATFATVGIGLVWAWQPAAASVVVAHAVACLTVCALGGWWLSRHWNVLPEEGTPPSPWELWSKLIRFTAWIWATSFLANLFDMADRYMLLHFSPLPPGEALAQVGAYHSSRVVPLLFVSVAVVLGSVLTPHLSHDWEAGRRQQVALRLNLFLKLIGFALSSGAAVLLLIAPLLFGVAFQGKFAAGLAVFPLTLTYCLWFGLSMIAQNYLWCAEKARLASLALLVGLLVNIGLNLVLLPRFGLPGAVTATTIANLVALLLVARFNHRLGFRMHPGTWIILAIPATLWLGPWVTLAVLAGVALEALATERILSAEEKQILLEGGRAYGQRFAQLFF